MGIPMIRVMAGAIGVGLALGPSMARGESLCSARKLIQADGNPSKLSDCDLERILS